MARRCARPDCHGLATTTLSYDYAGSAVWLDHLAADAHPMTHDLCDRHADSLSVPKGWQLGDRREPRPQFDHAAEAFNDAAVAS